MSATFTSDFRHEFEQEQSRWLRRRFLWYAGVVILFGLISLLFVLVTLLFTTGNDNFNSGRQVAYLQLAMGALQTAAYFGAFVYVRRTLMDRQAMLTLVFRLIVGSGLFAIVTTPMIFEISREAIASSIEQRRREGKQVTMTPATGVSIRLGDDSPEADSERAGEPDRAEPREEAQVGPPFSAEQGALGAAVDALPAGAEKAPLVGKSLRPAGRELEKMIAQMVVAGNNLGAIFLTHLFACLFLPWTPRESLRPMAPLLIASTLVNLYYIRLVPNGATLAIFLTPLTAAPGAAICWWRQGRFKDAFTYRMLKGRYGEIRQELSAAKQIHESLFPKAIAQGPVCMDFRYEPMRQIGGDYLYSRSTNVPGQPLPILHAVIIDVTGHGITAALTVNRLHGEIDRQFGERASTSPGELLTGLNAYLHHTLATHSVYATALCIQVDPNSGTLTWASAGHPPAFLRSVDGRIDRLDSTAIVLGACRGDDFEHGERLIRFGEGDTVIAYTDGAIEARDATGKMLKVAGMERLVASCVPDEEGGWSAAILREVDAFRDGPAEDDTLLVELWRPLGFKAGGRRG